MLKKILFGILGLVILLAVAFAVLMMIAPTDYAVEREIIINKPKAEVFEYLKPLRNQRNWTVWAKKDPNQKYTYSGNDGEVGFVAKWESENTEVGAGEQEITKVVEGERIEVELRFKRPFESVSNGHTITEAVDESQTKVKWGFSGSIPRPMNLMLLVVDLEAQAGAEFEEGLKSLKALLEKE